MKGRLFEQIRFSTKNSTKLVNRTFSFKPVFTFWLLGLNIRSKKETFSRKIFALLPDKLFKQGGLKLDFTLCEMSTG